MLRFLLWRLLGLLALVAGLALVGWMLEGGPGKLLRGKPTHGARHVVVDTATRLTGAVAEAALSAWRWAPGGGVSPLAVVLAGAGALLACLTTVRLLARRRRRYVRLRIEPHRTDQATPTATQASGPTTST